MNFHERKALEKILLNSKANAFSDRLPGIAPLVGIGIASIAAVTLRKNEKDLRKIKSRSYELNSGKKNKKKPEAGETVSNTYTKNGITYVTTTTAQKDFSKEAKRAKRTKRWFIALVTVTALAMLACLGYFFWLWKH